MDDLMRHVAFCNSARLPGERLPWRLAGQAVGWMRPTLAAALAALPGAQAAADGSIDIADPAALPGLARTLSEAGHYRWRGEAFDVRAKPEGPALGQLDRGALPSFGVMAVGVHVNALVRTGDGLKLWIGVRSTNRHLDPGKLDHLVAGGVSAGMTVAQTLLKEAREEADLPESVTARAVPAARIAYATERPEGLRRDLLYCYDLELPEEFVPHSGDGEAERFELWPLARALETVRAGDAFKFNVSLVLIDLFLRHGLIVGDEAGTLRAAIDHPVPGAPGVPAG
jgi:8-oxo-dGTP pyrophosphatase MutT (NUDIX family)